MADMHVVWTRFRSLRNVGRKFDLVRGRHAAGQRHRAVIRANRDDVARARSLVFRASERTARLHLMQRDGAILTRPADYFIRCIRNAAGM